MKFHKGVLLASLLSTMVGTAFGIELPDGFVDETYIDGFDGQVTAFDTQSQGRLFISEKSGIVRVAVDGQLLAEPFLDLTDIVNDRVDRGMLSLAVHPEFPQSPFIYVLYTYDPPELLTSNLINPDTGVLDGNGNRVARLVRYTADAGRDFNVALEGSGKVILGTNSTFDTIGNPEDEFDTVNPSCGAIGDPLEDCLPSDEITHTIGSLRFAEDGSLYVTNGDGASFRDFNPLSQMTYDLDSLRGKVLRIDATTGLGLPDNPFYDGNPASNRSRVVSYGLRNPYSMTVHPLTGVPYIGEVGDIFWEEINSGTGKNFGWPCYEGGVSGSLRKEGFQSETFCQELYESNTAVEPPIISWQHDGEGNAAIIGDFYFGEEFPEQYSGMLFYGDFIKRWLRYADVSDPDNVRDFAFATDMPPMVEMRSGDDGALYYASIATREIRRIRYIGGTPPDGGEGDGNDIPTDEASGDTEPDTKQVTVGRISRDLTTMLLLSLLLTRRFRLRSRFSRCKFVPSTKL